MAHSSELHESLDFNRVKDVEFEFACWQIENLAQSGENGQIQDGRQKLVLIWKTIDFNEKYTIHFRKNKVVSLDEIHLNSSFQFSTEK